MHVLSPSTRPLRARLRATLGTLAVLLTGCLASPTTPRPHEHPAPSVRLDRVLATADANPDDWRAQQRAGSALTREVLEGDISRFDEAVARLERAHQLHPGSRHIPRPLGRLLNLPLSQGDLRWADRQRTLYEQLANATAQASAPDDEQFVDRRFLDASDAAATYHAHDPVGAVVRLRRLERQVQQRLSEDDDVDLHAMLGNYAQQIAGLTSVGRARRVQLAIEHLDPVVRRWDELSLGARGLEYGIPGVRAVFTHWLAELCLADGRVERAHDLYAQVQALAEAPDATPAMHALADAAGRRRRSARVPSRDALLPVWPSGYDSCIACHAHDAVPHPPQPALPSNLARR